MCTGPAAACGPWARHRNTRSLPSACPNPLPSRTCTAIRAEVCPKVRHRESRGCTALLAPHSWLPPAPHPTAAPSFPPSVPPRAGLGSGAPSQPGAAVSPARSPPLPLLPPRLPELPLMPERAPARPSPAAARSPESPAGSAFPPAGSAARSRSRSPRPAAESPQRTRTCGHNSKCAQREAAAPAGLLPGWRRALPPPRASGPGRGATGWPVPADVILSPALGKHAGTRLLAAVGHGAAWGQPLLRNCPPPTPTLSSL